MLFFSFAWTSLRQGPPKERNDSEENEEEGKEQGPPKERNDSKEIEKEEKEQGHVNAGQILDETSDQVSKVSGDIHGDGRGM